MTGTRTVFVPDTADFFVRYGRRNQYQVAAVYMPDWTPDITDLPEWPVCHYFKGGTWAGSMGYEAQAIDTGFSLEVMLMLSNELGCVIVAHDYTPGGRALATTEDLERCFWPEILDDGALVVQHFKTIAESELFGDRPLTRDANKIMGFGSSSGGHRLAFSQIMPHGTFSHAPDRLTRDLYVPTYTHALNPMVLSITPLVLSTFSKGGAGWSYWETYKDASWAFPVFSTSQHEEEPGWGYDDIPQEIKRQSDLPEHIRADNPRVAEIGLYLSATHAGSFVPRPSVYNDPTGTDARSFKRRYWRYLGIDPEPIQTVRPVVTDGVSGQVLTAISDTGTPGEALFRRTVSDWVTDGFLVGDIVATSGWTNLSINDAFEVLRFEASNKDMVVRDTDDRVDVDDLVAAGQTVTGSGHVDLHDELSAYITYDYMLAHGNTRCRLRAGGNPNTNPDPLTVDTLASAGDVRDWLTATDGTGFAWKVPP